MILRNIKEVSFLTAERWWKWKWLERKP